jgi:hypothetical protein
MQTNEIIEDIITRELRGLCVSCAHADRCIYHKDSLKLVIQCEMFDLDQASRPTPQPLQGLCRTCDHAPYCKLPGRKNGVWRCNEFQ